MKKIAGILLVLVLIAGTFSGCASGNAQMQTTAIDAVVELKKSLKRPSTLELNEVLVVDLVKAGEKLKEQRSDSTSDTENAADDGAEESADAIGLLDKDSDNSEYKSVFLIKIDYSAENSYGGFNRDSVFVLRTENQNNEIEYAMYPYDEDNYLLKTMYGILEEMVEETLEEDIISIDVKKIMDAVN